MTESQNWDAILQDPVAHGVSKAEAERIRGEQVIAPAAHLLHARGHDHSAALMLDGQGITFENHYADGSGSWSDPYTFKTEAILDVESFLLARFTDERLAEITSALDTVRDHSGGGVNFVRVREVLPKVGEGWRQQLARDLAAERPSNQANRVRLEPTRVTRDGLFLTNQEENKVYTVLREVQESLPDNDTLLIAPLPGVRIPDHTYWPDFLIAYKGRAGVIEVDGPHHHGRRVADASRERLLRNAGIRHIDRIAVEDLATKPGGEKFVRDFLARLTAAWPDGPGGHSVPPLKG
jgi:hypothetical protein